MVRWRYCLVLTMLLLLPMKTSSKSDDDTDDSEDSGRSDTDSEDDDNESDDNDNDDDGAENKSPRILGRRAQAQVSGQTTLPTVTRTMSRRPLECYVCAYKTATKLRSCLDPTKYRVHTMTCPQEDDRCFTSVISKGSTYDTVIRGCRSNCVGSPETTCCEFTRCNNQALALPEPEPQVLTADKANIPIPPSIVFFVTILLVLQTVVKVAFV